MKTALRLTLFLFVALTACVSNAPDKNITHINPAKSNFKLGVQTHYITDTSLDRVAEMRINWIRTGVTWPDIEPAFETPPRYHWDTADLIVRESKMRGLKILWLVVYTPPWASTTGTINGVPKDATARERFRLFVRAVAERYRDDIDHFEIWNEPNLKQFWTGTVSEYIDFLLVPAYEEIKKVSSTKKVIGPALATISSPRIPVETFFRDLAGQRARQHLDAVSLHVYKDPDGIAEEFQTGNSACILVLCLKKRNSIFSILENTGFGNHTIWITEFGWKTNKLGESTQAEHLLRALQWFVRHPRFEAAFIYELRDDPTIKAQWGLLRADGTPKAAYDALRNRNY